MMIPLTFFNIGSHPVYVTWGVFGDIVGLNSPNTETIAAGLLNDDICSSDVCSTTIGTKYGNHGNRTHHHVMINERRIGSPEVIEVSPVNICDVIAALPEQVSFLILLLSIPVPCLSEANP
jgi:hypothetical protein